jgi:hypothetical protein
MILGSFHPSFINPVRTPYLYALYPSHTHTHRIHPSTNSSIPTVVPPTAMGSGKLSMTQTSLTQVGGSRTGFVTSHHTEPGGRPELSLGPYIAPRKQKKLAQRGHERQQQKKRRKKRVVWIRPRDLDFLEAYCLQYSRGISKLLRASQTASGWEAMKLGAHRPFAHRSRFAAGSLYPATRPGGD